jgi:uncharacterized surface protein with fasciclin (FAS1) repeats
VARLLKSAKDCSDAALAWVAEASEVTLASDAWRSFTVLPARTSSAVAATANARTPRIT